MAQKQYASDAIAYMAAQHRGHEHWRHALKSARTAAQVRELLTKLPEGFRPRARRKHAQLAAVEAKATRKHLWRLRLVSPT